MRPPLQETQDLLKDLNPDQKKAVVHGPGPLLIIAGAGTGKTRVITQRIAYLIAAKMARPEEILAVTFTEKAANEMEERVDQLIPYSYSFVEISTFNSFGERVLRNYALDLGYPPDFRLLDDVEQAIFFRERLFRFPLDYYRPLSVPTRHIEELLDTIKKLKQEDIRPGDYLRYAGRLGKRSTDPADKEKARKHLEIAGVFEVYESSLKKEGKIDFEDQVRLTVELFRKRASVLAEFQKKYKYILVDEFQDTNFIQFELLKLLAANHNNLTVVGDDDQSIFRFRGASLANILNFRDYYRKRGVKVREVILTRNYRSTQHILDSAYTLIQHNNPERLEVRAKVRKKLLSTVEKDGKSIHLLQFDTLSYEADRVAELIRAKWEAGVRLGEIAVLVRRNADADPFLRALNMKQVPFRFSGSRGLYAQEEVKILVSCVRAVTDFEDSRSLFFLAYSEVYRMDLYSLTVISNYAQRRNLPLHRVFREMAQGAITLEVTPEAVEKVRRIDEDLLHFVRLSETKNAGQVVFAFLEKTGYIKTLVESGSLEAELKIKNLRLFFDKIRNFSEVAKDDSIQAFARHVDLLQEVGDNPATAEAELEEEAVNVLTVHKSKGLEFEIVFMVSLIADRFPGRERKEKIPFPDDLLKERLPACNDSGTGSESLDMSLLREERRLFYVGMTRAKKDLYLTWARDYGLKRLKKVSPFVLEALDIPKLPEEVQRTSSLEEIVRYGKGPSTDRVSPRLKVKDIITLSHFQVEDYLVCPLKYQFRHVWRIPVPPHHALVFGRILHNVIHSYLLKRMAGEKVAEKELLREYERQWTNEGFLSREHEAQRKKAGREAMKRFFRREERAGRRPTHLEKSFKWMQDGIRFIGRWDRVDVRPEGAVIVDFKATQAKNQKEADKRAADSLQMDLYALSFVKIQNGPLLATELYFLESDLVGRAAKGEKEIQRAWAKIKEAEEGIRIRNFAARPDYHNCRLCEFKAICPKTYAY
ncbi:MAG: ATP-dependent DNA helicase [Candidatus Aminicenantales bacterium]